MGAGAGREWAASAVVYRGKLNLSHNCVDRHAKGARRDKVALVWESEPVSEGGEGEVRRLTYGELHEQVQAFANVLKGMGVRKGDRVAVYMGMCPELAIALLACARVGAVHLVVFGGFGAQALTDRINDAQCRLVISQDGLYRRGAEIKLKSIVDEAVALCPTVEKVLVHRRTGSPIAMHATRDHWLDDGVGEVPRK